MAHAQTPTRTAYLLYRVESGNGESDVLRAIAERYSCGAVTPLQSSEIYYDTFDWRLFGDGGLLGASELDSGWLLRWRSVDGSLRHRLRVDRAPGFARDLPRGPFREAVQQRIGIRRLLPLVRLDSGGRELRLLDERKKTTLRVMLEHPRASVPGVAGAGESLPPRLRLAPVRGFESVSVELQRFVERELGLASDGDGELGAALRAVGRQAGDYSSKLRVVLDPAMRTDDACRRIHRTLLETIRANERGTREELDPEFLHDFRVAVRRTRACLGQVKDVFAAGETTRFARELAWLGKATGPKRDLDVFLLELGADGAASAGEGEKAPAPLVEMLLRDAEAEQRRLVAALGSDRYRQWVADWSAFLDRSGSDTEATPNGERPVGEVAEQRVRRAMKRVLSRGAELGPDPAAAALHRLRIDCKKLRYLLELFRCLFEPRPVEVLVAGLKRLQDVLGDLNDFAVQRAALEGYAARLLEACAGAGTLLELGRMIERLAAREEAHRRRFSRRFEQFAAQARCGPLRSRPVRLV